MNRTELLFTQLQEEASEVIQASTKCMRFGPERMYPGKGVTNKKHLMTEVAEMIAMVEMLQEEGILPLDIDRDVVFQKKQKVEEMALLSTDLGLVENL